MYYDKLQCEDLTHNLVNQFITYKKKVEKDTQKFKYTQKVKNKCKCTSVQIVVKS